MVNGQYMRYSGQLVLWGLICVLAAAGSSDGAGRGDASPNSAVTTVTASPTASIVAIPEITVRASEFSFDAPSQVHAGLVSVTLLNAGTEAHLVAFGRIQPGRTY